MELLKKLRKRQSEGRPIKVGLVGCGQMGSGMVHSVEQIPGMAITAIADVDPERPRRTFEALNIPTSAICTTNHQSAAEDAIAAGSRVVTEDADLLTRIDGLDAIVEATGSAEVGARVAWNCVLNGRNVIMLNVETDVTVGPILTEMAKKTGCVYTVASGDEPGVCKTLYDFACSLGFRVVCVGKGKNNPVNLHANPDTARAEAERKEMNPKMLAAFQDGTKTMVEMAAVSNATGLLPDVPGMHGEKVELDQLSKVYVPERDGGILSADGCVEYTTGKVAPGVFVVCTSPDPRVRQDMRFLAMGDGPYYLLYRPYHLCNLETPISVAEAVLYGESTLVPAGMTSDVVAVAKRDLKAGEIIGDIGGFEVYHRIYRYDEAQEIRGIPMGMATGGRVVVDVKADTVLTEEHLALDTTRMVYKLRQLQDEFLRGRTADL